MTPVRFSIHASRKHSPSTLRFARHLPGAGPGCRARGHGCVCCSAMLKLREIRYRPCPRGAVGDVCALACERKSWGRGLQAKARAYVDRSFGRFCWCSIQLPLIRPLPLFPQLLCLLLRIQSCPLQGQWEPPCQGVVPCSLPPSPPRRQPGD